jgi:hypothetical protein
MPLEVATGAAGTANANPAMLTLFVIIVVDGELGSGTTGTTCVITAEEAAGDAIGAIATGGDGREAVIG